MRFPPIHIGGRVSLAQTEGDLRALLRQLIQKNIQLMMRRPRAYPPLGETRVVYKREPKNQERWLNADELLKQGFGDCEDLAAYETARLILKGVKAQGYLQANDLGYHVLVLIDGSRLYDPSRMLGMGRH